MPAKDLDDLVRDPDFGELEELVSRFDPFGVLGVSRREAQHSSLLAWLLDPGGSHGLCDRFLREFLSRAAARAGELGVPAPSPSEVGGWKLDGVEVATERWNIDVLLVASGDGLACVIENKVGSGERAGQLRRYLEKVERIQGVSAVLPIFLTPRGIPPRAREDAERYVPVDYRTVACAIETCLASGGASMGGDVVRFLEHYVLTLRRNVLDDADELAYRLYARHRDAMDRIIEARSWPRRRVWEFVDSAIDAHANDLRRDSKGRRTRRLYSPLLDDIRELREGSGWTGTGRVALFEFIQRPDRLDLYLMIGHGPRETRERLREVGLSGGDPWHPQPEYSKSNFAIYVRRILCAGDYREFDPKEAERKIDGAVERFCRSDLEKLVQGVLAAFGP